MSSKRDMEPGGRDSILFKQRFDYPEKPGRITYYPAEPSDDLKDQVKKDKTGGILFYIIGVAIAFIGLIQDSTNENGMELYSALIPIGLIFGFIAAFYYLYSDNVSLAKLSCTLPLILMVALLLLYITGLVAGIIELSENLNEDNINNVDNEVDNLFDYILNPAFFLIMTGIVIARAGGFQLWTATRIVHQYMPSTIILETTGQGYAPQSYSSEAGPSGVACSSCGEGMSYIEEYGRYYCYSCEAYAPAGTVPGQAQPAQPKSTPEPKKEAPQEEKPADDDEVPPPKCKTCNDEMEFIEEYERLYCYTCKKYD